MADYSSWRNYELEEINRERDELKRERDNVFQVAEGLHILVLTGVLHAEDINRTRLNELEERYSEQIRELDRRAAKASRDW